MEKYTSIDDFITAIVLNFESNKIVDSVLSKINKIIPSGRGINLDIVDNTILYEFKGKDSGTIEIEVDVDNKKIKSEDTGIKKTDDGIINYVNKYNYSVIGDKAINYSFINQYTIKTKEDNTTLIDAEITKKYKYFNKNKYIGLYEETNTRTVLKDENNVNINQVNNNIKKMEYVLATGDIIKIERVNDSTDYYFCSPNQKEKNSFCKKITKEDADRLFSLGDNIYDIINDEMVCSIRGASYS
ncbi:MAG: hypothetical protein ACI31R_02585 [Bacilli bacterium]